jgi:L-seryl-tRNA(Ser) seleniumtransferase
MSQSAPLRAIPSVDRILQELVDGDIPRPAVAAVVRRELASIRGEAAAGAMMNGHVIARIRAALDDLRRTRIHPVINATGIIVHTNLGRSPMGDAVCRTLTEVAGAYNNLEYDLSGGGRGVRAAYLEHNLAILCGAEAATVVNNCAAALLLALRHFAGAPPKNRVVISRGELVQIGGGFRIPEILQAGGASLLEIGTTNKTTLDDYRHAISADVAMVLKVYQSNFYMDGFVGSVSVAEIAPVTSAAGIPLVVDIGSGALFDTTLLGGGEREPTPSATLAAGADLITFSGDKLMGGPQAGIIAGDAKLIKQIKSNPLYRALRCDKLILAAMQTTVDQLLVGDTSDIPVRSMMEMPIERLRERGGRIVERLRAANIDAQLSDSQARVGGGSLPRTTIESITVDLICGENRSPDQLADALRSGAMPLIGYVADGVLKLDLLTVFESQDEQLIEAVAAAITGKSV